MEYKLVEWPESQELMDHERFNECLFVQDIEGHKEVGSSSYMCPIDLYDEIFNNSYTVKSKRIGNFEFRKASYLCDEPRYPDYHIDYYYPNPLYGKEHSKDYIPSKNKKDFYVYIGNPGGIPIYSHKDCFKHKEACFTIASFCRNADGSYNLSSIEDSLLSVKDEEIKDFWKIVKFGFSELDKLKEVEDA